MREEVLRALRRGREALAGLVLAALGLWGATATWGVTRWLMGAVVAVGLGLVWTGVQRWRFAAAREAAGAGLVRVDERRVEYWGPEAGGFLDLDELEALEIDRDARAWRLWRADGTVLTVPLGARGAGALFDLFAALPGMRMEALLAALGREDGGTETLWRAVPPEVRRLGRAPLSRRGGGSGP